MFGPGGNFCLFRGFMAGCEIQAVVRQLAFVHYFVGVFVYTNVVARDVSV